MTEKKEENKLEKLQKEYSKLQKEHELPDFEEMNDLFDIEELVGKETTNLLRLIRRRMTEKTSSYLRFTEIFLNPSQAPLFFMVLTKNISQEGRTLINEVYYELGRIEIQHLKLENMSDIKKEAEVIKEVHKEWKEISKKMLKLSEIFEEKWKEKKSESKSKTYFG